jgi:ribosome biogenesis protein Tsr3
MLVRRKPEMPANLNTWKKQTIEDYAAAIAIIRRLITQRSNEAYYLVDGFLFGANIYIVNTLYTRCEHSPLH